MHNIRVDIECPQCGQKFDVPEALKKHLLEECSQVFSQIMPATASTSTDKEVIYEQVGGLPEEIPPEVDIAGVEADLIRQQNELL